MIAALIGTTVGLGASLFGAVVGFDRERGFYPVVLIVIAAYYILFAAMGDPSALWVETALMACFAALAVAGFRTSPWLLVAGLLAHAGLDAVHEPLIANAGAPPWWPAFCAACDVAMAGWLAGSLMLRRQAGSMGKTA